MGPGLVSHWLWQSALRMRGLFNTRTRRAPARARDVSIRLADAWPFQRLQPRHTVTHVCRFNPPCGCVAFSTATGFAALSPISRFNPPCGCVAFSTRRRVAEVPDGVGFNPPCGCVAFSTGCTRDGCRRDGWFQSALRMRGLFNSVAHLQQIRRSRFQSALRMRGLFNRGGDPRVCPPRVGFNPPCGCVAFSTPGASRGTRTATAFQSALRMRGLFNAVYLARGQGTT